MKGDTGHGFLPNQIQANKYCIYTQLSILIVWVKSGVVKKDQTNGRPKHRRPYL